MPTHATRSPLGVAVPGAATVTDADRRCGGPNPMPEIATADRTSRQVARAVDGFPHPPVGRPIIPHALTAAARDTSPGRPLHSAAGGLYSEMAAPPGNTPDGKEVDVRSCTGVAHIGQAGGAACHRMTTVYFVRVCVFRMSQTDFATLLGTSQGRVSTWETSGRWPSVVVMDLVRMHGKRLCAERGEAWSDSWFFEVPDGVLTAGIDLAAE